MAQIKVVYYSGSGNTESMAQMLAKGIEEAGSSAELISVENADAAALAGESVLALGCPAMGDEVLEEELMQPLVDELVKSVSGKKVALFGSYGWGDGEWMRNWEEQMKNAGAELVGGEGVICADAPDDEAEAKLIALGKKLAE